ncbi:hypothetical protein DFH28DRAFT_1128092 [Melampsora americana]|nr:hypothetical protein DFH28DRAFT_1128092 [Melampsora americana]
MIGRGKKTTDQLISSKLKDSLLSRANPKYRTINVRDSLILLPNPPLICYVKLIGLNLSLELAIAADLVVQRAEGRFELITRDRGSSDEEEREDQFWIKIEIQAIKEEIEEVFPNVDDPDGLDPSCCTGSSQDDSRQTDVGNFRYLP